MDKIAANIQLIEQLVPFFFILLGFVLVAISIWGIVIYLRKAPTVDQGDQTKPHLK